MAAKDVIFGAERALEHHVTAFGAQGDLDRVGQDVHAFDQAGACLAAENNFFCCHVYISEFSKVGLSITAASS